MTLRDWVRKYSAYTTGMNDADYRTLISRMDLHGLHREADSLVGSPQWTARIEYHPQTQEEINSGRERRRREDLIPRAANPEHQRRLDVLMEEIRSRMGHGGSVSNSPMRQEPSRQPRRRRGTP